LSSAGSVLEDLVSNDPNNWAVSLSLALLRIQQGNFDKAGQLLETLKIQEPNLMPVKVAQIELNVHQGKSAEALQLCDEIVSKLKNASAYILRARTYSLLGRNDKAEEDLERAIAIEPNNVEGWVASCIYNRSIGQPDRAVADIQRALSLAPDNIQVQKRAISLFLDSSSHNRILQGRAILDKALTINPEDVELRLYQVRAWLDEGTAPAIENALQILEEITEDQPKVSRAWALLGELLLKQGQSGKAVDVALRGLAHTLNNKELLLLKARAEAERSPLLAIPTLKVLCEVEPNDVDNTVLLARTYLTAGESVKAVDLLKTKLASCSSGTDDELKLNTVLAQALHRNGKKADAQKILDSLFQSAPNDPRPLFAQVVLLKNDKLWNQLNQKVLDWCRNNPADSRTPIMIAEDLASIGNDQANKIAEDLIKQVLDNEPNSLPAKKALAVLLQMIGRFEESTALYKQIIAIQSDNLIVINNLAWVLCEEQHKYQEALELAQRGLKIAPQYIDLIDTRGVVYYRLGQCDKAAQDFTRCLKLYPKRTPGTSATYLHLARALIGLGQKSEAVENLNKALELNNEIGGLSAADAAETKRLLEELARGN
jgi:tetratricopeptide (TPR) repeat protein